MLKLAAAQLWLARGPSSGVYALDVLPALFLAAAGVAFSFTPTTLVITKSIPAERTGIASGLASASAQLGGALGIATFSTIKAAGSHGLTQHGAIFTDATVGGGNRSQRRRNAPAADTRMRIRCKQITLRRRRIAST